jgi:RNA polymerase sigma factor (TIGR02999 family)
LTSLLAAWRNGDKDAYDRLFELVQDELRQIAQRYMAGERPGHMLQPTALVNEAYLRLVEIQYVEWKDRIHFFAVAACVMRRILVDHARSRNYLKRGGAAAHVPLDEATFAAGQSPRDLVALDDALTSLAAVDERKSRVVELKFFGGLNLDEIAALLGVSTDTVKRDWKMAKVWLLRQMENT